MKYPKKLIIASAAVGVISAAGIGATAIAASNSDTGTGYPPIVQKIASTFGLDPVKVNDVFKQQRQDDMKGRQARLKSSLDQAVKDRKLTQDQEDKLIAELKTLHERQKDDKSQDRRALKSELEQWAKDNGITNLDQILPAPPSGRHPMPDDSDASARN